MAALNLGNHSINSLHHMPGKMIGSSVRVIGS